MGTLRVVIEKGREVEVKDMGGGRERERKRGKVHPADGGPAPLVLCEWGDAA